MSITNDYVEYSAGLWELTVNGNEYTDSFNTVEFEERMNEPVSWNMEVAGVDASTNSDFAKENIIEFKFDGTIAFRGRITHIDPQGDDGRIKLEGMGMAYDLKERKYPSSSNSPQVWNDESSDTIVSEIVTSNPTNTVNTVDSTNNGSGLDSSTDFRMDEEGKLSGLSRLAGDYGAEWWIDDSDNFNIAQQRGGGSSVKTYNDANTDNIRKKDNAAEGDFDGAVVKGYGDGEDQIKSTAGSTTDSDQVMVYTDKTITSEEQAQEKANSLNNSRGTEWEEVHIDVGDTRDVRRLGDVVTVQSERGNVTSETDYRVVERFYRIDFKNNIEQAKLVCNNRETGFYDKVVKQTEQESQSQTRNMQGARNVWGDKEAVNATNSDPLTLDFEVPPDVVDVANNNKLSRVEFNYACTPFRQAGNPTDISANNFDPSTKVVGTEIEPAGIEMERSNISQHNHAVGSATSLAATGRVFTGGGTQFSFSNTVPASGWTRLGGQQLTAPAPEEDIEHRIVIDIQSISSTTDLHYCILSSNPVANFTWDPLSPVSGEQINFMDTTSEPEFGGTVQEWQWDFGDGNTESITSGNSGDTTHSYSSSGTYTVTLEVYDGSSNLLDDVSKDVEVLSSTSASISKLKEGEITKQEFKEEHLDLSNGDVSTQDQGDWTHGGPEDYEVFWIDGTGDVDVSFDSAVSDPNETDVDIEFFLQKQENTDYFEYQSEVTGVNADAAYVFMETVNFDENDDLPFGDENYSSGAGLSPGGPEGEYSWSYRYTDSTGSYVTSESNPDRTFVVARSQPDLNITVDPDGDDASEAEFDMEGWFGGSLVGTVDSSSIETIELDIDGSNVYSDTTPSGGTGEVEQGSSKTWLVNGSERTVGVSDVVDSNTAELSVDGTTSSYDEGDTVISDGGEELRIHQIVDAYDITERDGSDYGADYSAVVLETYYDDIYDQTGLSDGDHTATLKFIDGSGTIIEQDQDNFTINLNDPPTADFTFSPTNPDAFETVNFTDQSTDPQGDSTIDTWEWDFGDGTTQTINSSPGDTSHSYSSGGTYTVTLTVTDDQGASHSIDKDVTVGDSDALANTVEYSGVRNVGASSSSVSSQVISNANTVDLSGVSNVGTQTSPANDSYMVENIEIPYRDISGSYEVYVASQGGGTPDVAGFVNLQTINHAHDIPRQDDFSDTTTDVGAGAENKEIPYQRATEDEGDVLLDFGTNNEAITLDTTVNGNDVTITVGNIDDDGNITNTEQISANNGTTTTTNTYQDDELYVRIDSANNKDAFEIRDQSGDDSYALAAAPEERFRSAKSSQQAEGVSSNDGSSQDLIESVDPELLAGSTANNVRIYIDDQPDSGGNTEQEITSDFYGGTNSGTSKDKELDLSSYVEDPGWYRLKVVPDQATFIKSRVFLDHHKDTQ